MCYVNLLESIKQYIAYTHVVYICVCYAYLSFTHPIVYDFFCCLRHVWKGHQGATPSIHMCSIRCSKPQGHQGPPTSCRGGKPLSEIIAEELAAEGLVEGWAFLPGSSPAPILAPKSASLGFMRPDRMFR